MKILLIHGYSAESKTTAPSDIESIYGTLPKRLMDKYGPGNVIDLNLGRYISLDDGVRLDDISRALQNAIEREASQLLAPGERFNVVIHSTGALVIRNWIRLFSTKPSPILNLIYLAGANFGSGWASIGKGQLAKWGRLVFEEGAERGLQVLNALELGSSDTIDLHVTLSKTGTHIGRDYGVQEFVIIGSQAHPSLIETPVAYAKEDGSDGVVRVSGGNVNFNYLRFVPNDTAKGLKWDALPAMGTPAPEYYRQVPEDSFFAGDATHPEVPLAIPYGCSHTGNDTGIVDGSNSPTREQIFALLTEALETPPQGMATRLPVFATATQNTYTEAAQASTGFLKNLNWTLQHQYDPHCQILIRLHDQDGRTVEHFDVYFRGATDSEGTKLRALFEDTHVNGVTPNVIAQYLRLKKYDQGAWVSQLDGINQGVLEIDAAEPASERIRYVPFHLPFTAQDLAKWLVPHRTTIFDIQLLRIPANEVFRIVKKA